MANVEEDHMGEEPEEDSDTLENRIISQNKAERKARRQERERQAAEEIHEAARGSRTAKVKSLENKVWMDGKGKRDVKDSKSSSKSRASGDDGNFQKSRKGKKPAAAAQTQTEEKKGARKTATTITIPSKGSKVSKKKTTGANKRKRYIASDESDHSDQGSESDSGRQPRSDSEGASDLTDPSSDGSGDSEEEERPAYHAVKDKEGGSLARHKSPSRLFDDDSVYGLHPPSGPATSESEFCTEQDTSMELSASSDGRSSPHQAAKDSSSSSQKKRKTSSISEAKFHAERPSIISAPPVPKVSRTLKKPVPSVLMSDSESEPMVETKWPTHAVLTGKGLLEQNVYIRSVCRKAIKIVEKTLLATEAWPELHRAGDYRVEVLTEAVKTFEGREYWDISKRITKDEEFSKTIGKWVIDRLPHHRSPVRGHALDHIAVFQLGVGSMCANRVEALLSSDTYVYPGVWGKNPQGQDVWVVNGKGIYLNRGIIDVLRASFFATQTALGFRYQDIFKSSHPERPELELPIPMVALAATGIHAALDSWKNGDYTKKRNERFDGETYKSVFHRHARYLEDLRKKSINAFHSIMSDLYKQVIGNDGQQGNQKQGQGNALSVLDLSGFD